MQHSFLIHSLNYDHLGCFQHLSIVNNAAMNTDRFFWIGDLGFLGYSSSGGITGLKGSSMFSFLRKFHTVFHRCCTSLHSHKQWTRVPISPYSLQHFLLVELFMMVFLTSVKCYLIVVLIFISLMASDIEHFSCVNEPSVCPPWRSVCSGPLPIFKLDCLSSWCWDMWVLYIFWRSNTCLRYHWQKYFSHTIGSLFILMTFSLAVQKLLNLMSPQLFILPLISLAVGDILAKI